MADAGGADEGASESRALQEDLALAITTSLRRMVRLEIQDLVREETRAREPTMEQHLRVVKEQMEKKLSEEITRLEGKICALEISLIMVTKNFEKDKASTSELDPRLIKVEAPDQNTLEETLAQGDPSLQQLAGNSHVISDPSSSSSSPRPMDLSMTPDIPTLSDTHAPSTSFTSSTQHITLDIHHQVWLLITAIMHRKMDIVRSLLDGGIDINTRDEESKTLLYLASFEGYVDIVTLLLDRGADVNAADNTGWTPLFVAVSEGHVDVITLLLNRGADMNVKDEMEKTPFFETILTGHIGVVTLFLEAGADVNGRDNSGRTPLLLAASEGHVEVVRLLLDKGADVNAKLGDSGQTVLFLAAYDGNVEIVSLLIDRGADVNQRDRSGRSPLFEAESQGRMEVVRVLLDRGAQMF